MSRGVRAAVLRACRVVAARRREVMRQQQRVFRDVVLKCSRCARCVLVRSAVRSVKCCSPARCGAYGAVRYADEKRTCSACGVPCLSAFLLSTNVPREVAVGVFASVRYGGAIFATAREPPARCS